MAVAIKFVGFELSEDFSGAFVNVLGDSGEAGDVDTVATVCAAGNDAVKKNDLVFPFFD